MRALFITYVLATLEVVKGIPLERKHKVDCANLAGTFVNNAALIHHAQSVPIGGLTLSDDGNSVQNQVPLCHVQGTIDYIAGGDATPDPRRNNTLTWELYLPDEPYYNGRFLAVGKSEPAMGI